MRERSRGACRESWPNKKNTDIHCENVIQSFENKTINARTLTGRVQRIIAKHTEYIGLLTTYDADIRKNNKCVNVRGARGENRCQT